MPCDNEREAVKKREHLKKSFSAAVLIGSLSALPGRVEAQILLDTLLKDCEQKTIVYGRDEKGGMVKVGERISGYCQGVLEGVLATLARNRTICVKEKGTSPDFLLSTVLTYRTETKSKDNDAAAVLEAAFKRAFTCTP
jgi:hypothetical protein